MFRRFMIVCWVLFAIAVTVSVVSFAGLVAEADSFVAGTSADGSIAPDVLADLNRQARIRRLSASPFFEPAYMARAAAIVILLWNVLCHTVAWVIAGRNIPRGVNDG